MFESIIMLLIYICLVVAACWVIIWVIQQLGVPLPEQAIKILWVIVALVVILLVYRMISPIIGSKFGGLIDLCCVVT